MLLICALIVLDWLYLAWLKLLSICFKLCKALFSTGKSNNYYGHEQVCLKPELWMDLLPPKQLSNWELADARLRDIADRHRKQVALNASRLSLQIDTMLICLLWILCNCYAIEDTKYNMCALYIFFIAPIAFINSKQERENLLRKFVALVDTVWPRHSKLIVHICKRMDSVYDWISTNHPHCLLSVSFTIQLTTIIAMIIWLCRFWNEILDLY